MADTVLTWLQKIPESALVFAVGLAITIVGLAIALVPEYVSSLGELSPMFSHLGMGVTAVGLLTMVLEPMARRRHKKDIAELRSASAAALLKTLVPDAVYREIEEQIIRQPFMREKFQLTLTLAWNRANKAYLDKTVHLNYEVRNVTHVKQEFPVLVGVDCEHEGMFPNTSKLESAIIEIEGKEEKFDENPL